MPIAERNRLLDSGPGPGRRGQSRLVFGRRNLLDLQASLQQAAANRFQRPVGGLAPVGSVSRIERCYADGCCEA